MRQLLAWLTDRFGEDDRKGRIIGLQLTHQEIADLIGLAAQFKIKRQGGELCIRFSQFDELDALLKKLGIVSA